MPLEQREPTKSLDERTADVMKAIRVLRGVPRYPEDKDVVEFTARMLAQFIQTVEVNHTNPEFPRPDLDLGWVNPLSWIVEQVAQTCFSFPPPIKWRTIYETRFTPLDRKEAAAMQLAMEE